VNLAKEGWDMNQREELSRFSTAWPGWHLPDVHTVYLRRETETETDGLGRKLPPPEVATPGGVYIWPNGYITCYTDEDGNQNEGVIYPPDAIERLEFGAL
jgi:hypothetical protein